MNLCQISARTKAHVEQLKIEISQGSGGDQELALYEQIMALRASGVDHRELYQLERELEQFEVLLKENPQRFVIFPIQFAQVWKVYKDMVASFWTTEEITLTDDLVQWRQVDKLGHGKLQLSDNDRFFIKHVLAFFASFDGIVNENLALRFYSEVQIPEARCVYGFQIAMENIHGETYSQLIDTLVDDAKERHKLFHAVENYPSIRKLADWALKWLDSDRPFNQRLIAFAAVEGILFSAPFCAIFWLKKRGLMPGLTFSNELISRDERLHMDFACLLHSLLVYPATDQVITEIIQEAVTHGKEFITESLPCNLIGMNANDMSQYLEYVGDFLLTKLGCPKAWNATNPFPWMDLISTDTFVNFFEKRNGAYGRAKFTKQTSQSDGHNKAIAILDDF